MGVPYGSRAQAAARRFNRNVHTLLGPRMIRIMNEAIKELRDYVVRNHMGGDRTGPNRLARNTGKMEQKTIATRAKQTAEGTSASIKVNVKYASTHIAEANETQTIIRPRLKQALAIPLSAVKGADKRARFKPRSRQISDRFLSEGIIYGRLPGGATQLPLFVLRPQVVVPKRISVKRDIEPEGQRILARIVDREVKKIFGEVGNDAG